MKRRKIYFAPSSSLLLLLPRHPSLPETHTHTLERTTNPPFECVCFTTEQREYALLLQKLSSKIFSYKINSAAKKKLVFLVALTFHFEADQKTKMSCVFHFFFSICVSGKGEHFSDRRDYGVRVYFVCVCVCVFRLWIYYDYIRLFVSFFFPRSRLSISFQVVEKPDFCFLLF